MVLFVVIVMISWTFVRCLSMSIVFVGSIFMVTVLLVVNRLVMVRFGKRCWFDIFVSWCGIMVLVVIWCTNCICGCCARSNGY